MNNELRAIKYLVIFGLFVPAMVFALIMRAAVETREASGLTVSSAWLSGAVTDDGGCADLELWFEYGETASYGKTTAIEHRSTIGVFSATVSGLSACTTYHFRAAARNNTKKTGYGEDRTFTTLCPTFNVTVLARNLTRGDTSWYTSLTAEPGDRVRFRIVLTAGSGITVDDVNVRANLAQGLIYEDNLQINDASDPNNIAAASVSIGDILPNQVKAIMFDARVQTRDNLLANASNLVSSVLVRSDVLARTTTFSIRLPAATGSAGIPIARAAEPPTSVSTGVTGNLLLDCLLLPLATTLFLVWVFRSKLIGFDRWSEQKKKDISEYRAHKQLQRKIAQVRVSETN